MSVFLVVFQIWFDEAIDGRERAGGFLRGKDHEILSSSSSSNQVRLIFVIGGGNAARLSPTARSRAQCVLQAYSSSSGTVGSSQQRGSDHPTMEAWTP